MNKLFVSLVISSALLTGCASNNKVSENKFSGFLNDYSILKPMKDYPSTMGYYNTEHNWNQYDSIMIDDVLVITPDDKVLSDDKLLVEVADKYKELLTQNLSAHGKIVNHASPSTIRIQAAMTGVYTSYDDLRGFQYIPVAAAVTGARRAAGGEKQAVRVMAEMRLLNSANGQLLAQAVDLQSGKEVLDANKNLNLDDVTPILEQWAQRVAKLVVKLRRGVKE